MLERFFQKHLVPLAEKLRAQHVQFFSQGADDDASSWYVDDPADTPELYEFDMADALAELKTLWQRENHGELTPLVEPLAQLAEKLKTKADDQSDEVSPFMYVMF
jgi:hypothetical protein